MYIRELSVCKTAEGHRWTNSTRHKCRRRLPFIKSLWFVGISLLRSFCEIVSCGLHSSMLKKLQINRKKCISCIDTGRLLWISFAPIFVWNFIKFQMTSRKIYDIQFYISFILKNMKYCFQITFPHILRSFFST